MTDEQLVPDVLLDWPDDFRFLGWMCPVHYNVMPYPKPAGHWVVNVGPNAYKCDVPVEQWVQVYRIHPDVKLVPDD